MDKLTEIKEKLNVIYKEYKNNKSQLNGEKTRMAAKLIVEMTFSENVNPSDVAAELARFSADIVNVYFESLTKSANIPLGVLDEVLKEWYSTDKDSKLSQHYVQKYKRELLKDGEFFLVGVGTGFYGELEELPCVGFQIILSVVETVD